MPVKYRHFLFNMKLAIDIGNSFIHFAVYKNSLKIYASKCSSSSKSDITKSLTLIKKIFKIEQIGIASVNILTEKYVKLLSISKFKITPLTVNNKTKLPIKIKIKSSATLGADRICNAVYGFEHYKKQHNVLIADLGTANTYDVVTKKGDFIGGIIAPGIMTSSSALNLKTSKLPLLPFDKLSKTSPLIGKNTFEAIQSGLVNYMKLATEGIVQNIQKHFKGNLKVILTGGSSVFLHKKVNFKYYFEENTVLEGINIILNYQDKR